MKTPQKFKLSQKYITSVPETKMVTLVFPNGESQTGSAYGVIDHPNFTKLRNKLEKEGYIEIEHSWWNGDRVLQPFTLNKMRFKKGDQFPCASALSCRT